jgi:serine protease Do
MKKPHLRTALFMVATFPLTGLLAGLLAGLLTGCHWLSSLSKTSGSASLSAQGESSTSIFADAQAQTSSPNLLPAIPPGAPLPANAFVELAKIVNPAVVNIFTLTTPRHRGRMGMRDPLMEMLEQFYGFRVPDLQIQPQTALGTGFVIRADGLIMTNNHVIDGADKIQVQFFSENPSRRARLKRQQGRTPPQSGEGFFDATVIGSDARTDIALIKIEGSQFPVLSLGSSASTQVGEWVAAFGNPFGNGHTMTKGIISAKGRDISEINRFPLLQTDAPINQGNSGGPLVNLRGEVIGVNSAIDARAQGIGFAIPIDDVKRILPQLEKTGRIQVGFLGVALQEINPIIAKNLGLSNEDGALVMQVEPNSPAASAGIRVYDVITKFGNHTITSVTQLQDAVADTPIGQEVLIKVMREGRERTLKATIAERPSQSARVRNPRDQRSAPTAPTGLPAPFNLGFSTADPSPAVIEQFRLPGDISAPIVVSVDLGSRAAQAGLLAGDVILDVNRNEVRSAQQVNRKLRQSNNSLRVNRQGSILFLVI